MKSIRNIALASLLLFGAQGCSPTRVVSQTVVRPPTETVSYQRFYDELSPYGRWVEYPGYGYVWAPAEAGFVPYNTNGHWVYTNAGWGWESNYAWGWAPFHYGRWFYETGYGWLWVPGYEWAPAWVSWRSNSGYYGWTPLPPGISIGVNFSVPAEHWTFVDRRYINETNFHPYVVQQTRIENVYNNTTIINNTNYTDRRTVYATGPARTEVEKVTNQTITPLVIQHTPPATAAAQASPRRSQLQIYKPAIAPAPASSPAPRPQNALRYQDLPRDNGQRGTWGAGMEGIGREAPRTAPPVRMTPPPRAEEFPQRAAEPPRMPAPMARPAAPAPRPPAVERPRR